ncbi:MAG: YceH family protein [Acidimicrobiales bacterium]
MEELSPEEQRVLGALVEKGQTSPEQYPLTLNALVAACNQASSRAPVVAYGPSTVEAAVALLRQRGLARQVLASGNRATKYRHVLDEALGLTAGECAVLAVLFLRGPQTASELRARTERYHPLDDLGGVVGVLDRLATRYAEPYVRRLDRTAGQREERWAQLMGGEPCDPGPGPVTAGRRPSAGDRLSALAGEVADLRAEVEGLRAEVDELRLRAR